MTKRTTKINIPVSVGELVDKITILELKSQRIEDRNKLAIVSKELKLLEKLYDKLLKNNKDVLESLNNLRLSLSKVNLRLWNLEDKIRQRESAAKFDEKFVEFARSIYVHNDRRMHIKNHINELVGSDIAEVKQYSHY